MNTNPIVISDGHAAAERCRPYMDKARTSFLDACKKIGKEYGALPRDEKIVFRQDLQLSSTTVKDYTRIATKAEKKLEIIQSDIGMSFTQIPSSKGVWTEIVSTDDKVLSQAAKAGLFTEYEVTKENISHFKKTGQLPAIKKAEKNPTAFSQIKHHLQSLEKSLNQSIGYISRVQNLIDEHDINKITGPEVRDVHKQFKNLCAAFATTNPELVDEAIKVLRGEK